MLILTPLKLQTEIDRLKLDLVSANKTVTDQTTRIDKQKKHEESLTSRINDLSKASNNDKTELRELRIKLKSAEHDKNQLASKQSSSSDLKKSLQTLEVKRRDELRERDKKILELEKRVASEAVVVPGC